MASDVSAHVGETDADALSLAETAMIEAEAELDAFAADMTLRRAPRTGTTSTCKAA